MVQAPEASWIEQFRSEGYSEAAPLGGGMEGAVYRLEDGLVAKVWANKQGVDLETLKAFYEELGEQSLPFATPRIHRVEEVAGMAVTYEAELPGAPLQERLAETDETAPADALRCVLDVLGALRETSAGPATRRLPILDEDEPFAAERDWPTALVAGMDRRVGVHGGPLLAALPDAPRLVEQIGSALTSLPRPPEAIVHGDLCAVNVLVDDALEPRAVLDWGFSRPRRIRASRRPCLLASSTCTGRTHARSRIRSSRRSMTRSATTLGCCVSIARRTRS